MVLLLVYLAIALGVSFLCSMLEAVLLSVPQSHIAVMVEKGSKNAKRLERMKKDVDKPLAAILTLNTFAHTLGAAGVGAQAANIWNDAVVGLVSFVVTVLILVFSEIIPKTLGAVHAKTLSVPVAFITHWLIMLLYPIVAACNGVSWLISGGGAHSGPQLSRDEMRTLANLAYKEGVIDKTEAAVLRNLIALREARVDQILTPRTVVYTLNVDQTVAEVTSDVPPSFARIPIIGDSLDDTRGVLHRRELFEAMGEGKGDTKLGEIARELHAVPATARLPQVLSEFVKRHEQLFLVVDEFGGSVGIVTLEDIIESLLGVEIIDETDDAVDMQVLAKQLLERRASKREQTKRTDT